MELTGERRLPAERATAWGLLNDAEVLRQCVPGCESMTATGANSYELIMTAAVGPVKARFKGRLALTDIEPPQRYRLTFEGQSSQAGFARGEARVELTELSPTETLLGYSAHAQIGGKLAQIGSRLVDAAAAATAEKFFQSFAAQLAARAPIVSAADTIQPAPQDVTTPPASHGSWLSWLRSFLRHLWGRAG